MKAEGFAPVVSSSSIHILVHKEVPPSPSVSRRRAPYTGAAENQGGGWDRPTAPRPNVQPRNKEEVSRGSPAGVSGACPVVLRPPSDFFRAPAHESSTGAGPYRVLPLSGMASAARVPSGEGLSSRGSRPRKHRADPPRPLSTSRRPLQLRVAQDWPDTSIGGAPGVDVLLQSSARQSLQAGNKRQCGELQPRPPQVRPVPSKEYESPSASSQGIPGGYVDAGTGLMKAFYPGG
ncbi:hypothetical protein NDU88_005730 [Pleurodeles waltl]|uniref:Uncharacterized protein n=1 Tax=Pleurodeles waltl TaxID=8319 RepID=A0AAV7UIU9_PLEWA|nr:hypothetical protein NDU88_005730 [Pleurodeles waltl]